MKHLYLLIVLLALHYFVSAQHYECFAPTKKHFFINSLNYLRGIRIDSVRTNGNETRYYPFHSLRGPYKTTGDVTLDSNGGSWLGKEVIENVNGDFLFPNCWNDTVVIKTRAGVNDTWILYDDSSTLHYIATVISVDTMSFLGYTDSVKRISISVYDGNWPMVLDSLNNFEIILSKSHGFIKTFDLYTFPYHAANKSFVQLSDYFLDKTLNKGKPNSSNSLFSIIDFKYPTDDQLYNWDVGDVYEYEACPLFTGPFTTMSCPPQEYYMDTVKHKTINSNGDIIYDMSGWKCTWIPPDYNNPPPYNFTEYVKSSTAKTLTYKHVYPIDTNAMPEEYGNNTNVYYYPGDNSFCTLGDKYQITPNDFLGNKLQNPITSSLVYTIYKENIGLINYYSGNNELIVAQKLDYVVKNNQPCGNFFNLSVKEPDLPAFKIFPDPAKDLLEIEFADASSGNYQIYMTDIFGHILFSETGNQLHRTYNIDRYSNGLYFIKITNASGLYSIQKIVISR
jgi:hypothetical protein